MVETKLTWLDELHTEKSSRSGLITGRPSIRVMTDTVAYLSGGFPDPRVLPKDTVIEATRTALEREGEWALQYGPTAGDPVLAEALLTKLRRDQGIQAEPENLLITAGASEAIALITAMLIEPGDIVISEAPTWSGSVRAFGMAGAEVREIGVDSEGTDVAELERVLNEIKAEGRQAKLLYVIPNFQNPTGITTTLERRRRIVELANQHGVPIVEDDAYFDMRFEGETVSTLYSLDETGSVMYLGTFSKNMAAGMRLGWAVAHPGTIRRMIGLKFEGGTSPFASHVTAEWMNNGTFERHLVMLREYYQGYRDIMLDALSKEMPDGAHWTNPQGGFFIWLTLPEGVDSGEVARIAADRGVVVSSGSGFYFSDRGQQELRLSFSFATEDEMRTGITILGEVVRSQQA